MEAGTTTASASVGPPAPEQQPEHRHSETDADQRRDPELLQGGDDLAAAVRHHLRPRSGTSPFHQFPDSFVHAAGERHGVRLRRAKHPHQDSLLAVQAEERAVLHFLQAHPRDVAEKALSPRAVQPDRPQALQRGDLLPHEERPDRGSGAHPAGRQRGAHRAQPADQVRRRQTAGGERRGSRLDHGMQRRQPDRLDAAGALQARQLGYQELARERSARRAGGAAEHRHLDDRLGIARGKLDGDDSAFGAFEIREQPLRLDAQAVRVGLPLALHPRMDDTVAGPGVDRSHAGQSREAALQRPGQPVEHLLAGAVRGA